MAAIDSHLAMEQRAAGDCHPTLGDDSDDDSEDDNHGDHDEFDVVDLILIPTESTRPL